MSSAVAIAMEDSAPQEPSAFSLYINDLFGLELLDAGYFITPQLVDTYYRELGVTPTEYALLRMIFRRIWRATQHAWPCLQTIAEELGKSIRQTRRYAQRLCEKGCLERIPCFRLNGGQTTNRYNPRPFFHKLLDHLTNPSHKKRVRSLTADIATREMDKSDREGQSKVTGGGGQKRPSKNSNVTNISLKMDVSNSRHLSRKEMGEDDEEDPNGTAQPSQDVPQHLEKWAAAAGAPPKQTDGKAKQVSSDHSIPPLETHSFVAMQAASQHFADRNPKSSATQGATVYALLREVNDAESSYALEDLDQRFAICIAQAQEHIRNATIRMLYPDGTPNSMPLFFSELKKRVKAIIAEIKLTRRTMRAFKPTPPEKQNSEDIMTLPDNNAQTPHAETQEEATISHEETTPPAEATTEQQETEKQTPETFYTALLKERVKKEIQKYSLEHLHVHDACQHCGCRVMTMSIGYRCVCCHPLPSWEYLKRERIKQLAQSLPSFEQITSSLEEHHGSESASPQQANTPEMLEEQPTPQAQAPSDDQTVIFDSADFHSPHDLYKAIARDAVNQNIRPYCRERIIVVSRPRACHGCGQQLMTVAEGSFHCICCEPPDRWSNELWEHIRRVVFSLPTFRQINKYWRKNEVLVCKRRYDDGGSAHPSDR